MEKNREKMRDPKFKESYIPNLLKSWGSSQTKPKTKAPEYLILQVQKKIVTLEKTNSKGLN